MSNTEFLSFHHKAEENFNKKAHELFSFLTSSPTKNPKPGFRGERPSREIGEVLEIGIGYVQKVKELLGIHFFHNRCQIGLDGENYQALDKLSRQIADHKACKDRVSVRFARETIFHWMKERYLSSQDPESLAGDSGEIWIPKEPMEFFRDACSKEVKEREYWIPVAGLEVQTQFSFAGIIVLPITAQLFESWFEWFPREEERAAEFLERNRLEMQGLAAGYVKLEADKKKGEEEAFRRVDVAISLIRFFSPPAVTPELVSYCQPLGREHRRETRCIVRCERAYSYTHGAADSYQPWRIPDSRFDELNRMGFGVASYLVTHHSELSDFQKSLYGSLLLVSRSALQHDTEARLLYLFAALESLLLMDRGDHPTSAVSERLAFFMKNDSKERRRIVRLVKDVYNTRSMFVHHGEKIPEDKMKNVRDFCVFAWSFFLLALGKCRDWKDKGEFLHFIDEKKYGGDSGC